MARDYTISVNIRADGSQAKRELSQVGAAAEATAKKVATPSRVAPPVVSAQTRTALARPRLALAPLPDRRQIVPPTLARPKLALRNVEDISAAASTNERIHDERLALLREANYGKYILWKNFGFQADARLSDLELEEEIMKLTPKTLLGKLKRKIGFSDKPHPSKSKDDEVITFGFTRRQLLDYSEREGITLEELLSRAERHEKEVDAMKPEDRPIMIM